MGLLKDFKSMGLGLKILLVTFLFILFWGILWPRKLKVHKIENYENDKNEPCFVMFYAPWCGYCKKTMPEWDKLESSYKKCPILKVNCDENKELAKIHNVQSYPTIKYLPKGLNSSDGAKDYEGNRTMSDFSKFLDQHVSGDPSKMPYQGAPLSDDVPPYKSGQGPLTTSYVARNLGLS
jgi:protein disulfide-isomerase-like protein